ncbi:hypothetical protein [Ruegeria arenilitoris]|uniref:hypothetical protein n=1 Tax=Ruegeria arenilitoris TaxID=1173585 RepID=UPI00147BAAF3|nr:hypothetical protein [Ruegeria arenilitoris]
MRTGFNGRVAISWIQTELDGLEAAPRSFLKVGAAWSWRGQAVHLAEPVHQELELSGGSNDYSAKYTSKFANSPDLQESAMGSVVLTNGAQKFAASLFLVSGESDPVLMFENGYPARDQEFWVSEITEYKNNSASVRLDRTVVAFPTRSPAIEGWAGAVKRANTTAD